MDDGGVGVAGGLLIGVVWLVFAAVYLVPTIVAVVVKNHRIPLVALVNVLLGWTVAGWVVALVLALTRRREPTAEEFGGAPGYPVGYTPPGYDPRPATAPPEWDPPAAPPSA